MVTFEKFLLLQSSLSKVYHHGDYIGEGQLIEDARHALSGELRDVLDMHFTWSDVAVKEKAQAIEKTPAVFYDRLGKLQSFLLGYMARL